MRSCPPIPGRSAWWWTPQPSTASRSARCPPTSRSCGDGWRTAHSTRCARRSNASSIFARSGRRCHSASTSPPCIGCPAPGARAGVRGWACGTLRAGLVVEVAPPDAGPRILDAVAQVAGAERLERPVQAGAGGTVLVRARMASGARGLLRVTRAGTSGDPAAQADTLERLATARVPLAPRPLGRGVVAGASWTAEKLLPGHRPRRVTPDLVHQAALACGRLPISDAVPTAPVDDLLGAAAALPSYAADLRRLADRVRSRLDGIPAVQRHGDLWAGNLLVDRGRLTGIVDWDAARTAPACPAPTSCSSSPPTCAGADACRLDRRCSSFPGARARSPRPPRSTGGRSTSRPAGRFSTSPASRGGPARSTTRSCASRSAAPTSGRWPRTSRRFLKASTADGRIRRSAAAPSGRSRADARRSRRARSDATIDQAEVGGQRRRRAAPRRHRGRRRRPAAPSASARPGRRRPRRNSPRPARLDRRGSPPARRAGPPSAAAGACATAAGAHRSRTGGGRAARGAPTTAEPARHHPHLAAVLVAAGRGDRLERDRVGREHQPPALRDDGGRGGEIVGDARRHRPEQLAADRVDRAGRRDRAAARGSRRA